MTSSAKPRRFAVPLRTAAFAFGALLAAALPGAAQTLVKVGVPVGTVPGLKAAIEEGYFQKENIAIQFVTLSGGPAIITATVGGSVDVGYADMFAWVGSLENGFDLVLLQPANGRGASDYIIAGPKSGIKTPQDLRGKKIGIAAHVQSKLRVTLYLERFGLKPSDVTLVTVAQRDTVGAALASGQIDAAIAPDPDVAQWEQQFKVYPLDGRPWQQVPEAATTAGFFVTKAWLAANPKVAEGFVRAARKGAARYNALSAEDKAKIVLKYDKLDFFELEKTTPGVLARLNDDIASQDGPIDLTATGEWLAIAQKYGLIKNTIDLKAHLYRTATEPKV
ncbi:ABC transporter substrate-binding protein [Aquabacter sp. CN5-332]|uniref:ABC transporter substrate-binding protein n=1 Tax=Aquabacter sp. CN5-332 TaxID=3156608 RepID=UPI0032B56C87